MTKCVIMGLNIEEHKHTLLSQTDKYKPRVGEEEEVKQKDFSTSMSRALIRIYPKRPQGIHFLSVHVFPVNQTLDANAML